jgi:hypothetical protein
LKLFRKYFSLIKNNDIYFLATILDPRIKTKWIKDYIKNLIKIITHLRTFFKDFYYHELELSSADEDILYKSLEYRFLKPYATNTDVNKEHDIDRYFNFLRVKYKPKPKKNQI